MRLLPKLLLLLFFLLPAPARGQASGTVEGVVTVQLRPPRRSAGRYPGGAPAPRAVQDVPAVVFVKGKVEGAGAPPRSTPAMLAQRDTAFVPAATIVEVGQSVRFPNEDPFFHNVFSYSAPARFDLGRYPRGEAKAVTFDKPGVVKVYCEVHEFMRSVVVVTENPFHAVVGADGGYRITGLPPGTYTLVFLHPDLEPQEREVGITAGAVARLDVQLR